MIIYYSICSLIAFVTFRDVGSPLLKWSSAIIGASFVALVAGLAFWTSLIAIADACVLLAGVLFIAGIARHEALKSFEKVLLIVYVAMIMARICFIILHLNGANEMSLLCLGIIGVTALWVLYMKFIGKSLGGKIEVIEVAGLFACFMFPVLLRFFR